MHIARAFGIYDSWNAPAYWDDRILIRQTLMLSCRIFEGIITRNYLNANVWTVNREKKKKRRKYHSRVRSTGSVAWWTSTEEEEDDGWCRRFAAYRCSSEGEGEKERKARGLLLSPYGSLMSAYQADAPPPFADLPSAQKTLSRRLALTQPHFLSLCLRPLHVRCSQMLITRFYVCVCMWVFTHSCTYKQGEWDVLKLCSGENEHFTLR